MDLRISASHRLNSKFMNFIPFAPLPTDSYMTRLVLQEGAKFWKESYLRIDRECYMHEGGLIEAREKLSGKKVGGHLRVSVEGEGGIERLMGALEKRGEVERRVSDVGDGWEGEVPT